MFSNQNVQAVARILAVTVLLDQRQRDREMIEFCHYVMTINHNICSKTILPRETILNWFEVHKVNLTESLASDTDGSFKTEILKEITDKDTQKQVLTAIFAICICDYELHDEETSFIKLALKLWKSDLPNVANMTQMAG